MPVWLLGALLAATLLVNAACAAKGGNTPQKKVTDVLQPIDLRQVKLQGEFGRRIGLTVNGNLLKIDIDKDFLPPFQTGLASGVDYGDGPYVGLGKSLDGMVRLAANTRNKALTDLTRQTIDKLIATQQPDGYIGYLPVEQRTWWLWDIHEQTHIIMALVADYRCFGQERSLKAARKLGDYIINRWPTKPVDWGKQLPTDPQNAIGGAKTAYLDLYNVTGDTRYLSFSANELETRDWDWPIVTGRFWPIRGHVYGYFYQCLSQLQLYRTSPEAKLFVPTQRAIDFMLTGDGMGVNGGAGKDECWTDDQDGTGTYAETCATFHQMLVYDELLRLHGDARWGDIMERTLYNAAFAAQSPDGRRIRYYAPFEGPRVYFGSDGYCCPGNFRRMVGYLPQYVYYRGAKSKGLTVNLYNTSRAAFQEGKVPVTVRQETDYPSSGRVTLSIDPRSPKKFPLFLRIPRWCTGARASVNGKQVRTAAKPGTFLKIDRTWKRGDKVELNMPMTFRFVSGTKKQEGRAAILRGPVLYTLSPSSDPALTGMDLKRLVILPNTAKLLKDDSVRPGGTSCRIEADLDTPGNGALTLNLQEFPHPDGQLVYFKLADPSAAVRDELMQRIKI